MEKSKICIIHPEGNINNNPNLSGIVEILCKNQYLVDIYSMPREAILQKNPCPGSHLIIQKSSGIIDKINNYAFKFFKNYDLFIGVDDGIIEAAFLARLLNISYGLISYEIFFADEINSKSEKINILMHKSAEIEACKDIDFAVVQDELRGSLLSKENKILSSSFLYMPVAGRGTPFYEKMNFWHKAFSIPENHKIALYMGSADKWAMIEELLQASKSLPANWHLVIHDRYGLRNIDIKYANILKNSSNIHISNHTFDKFEDMKEPLFSADAGIAFYKPVGGPLGGKNLKYIGLSSGKISTYLQHGLPVITNAGSPWPDFFKKYNIGINLDSINELNLVLSNWEFNNFKPDDCIDFFKEYLDLDKTIIRLLEKIKKIKINSAKDRKNKIWLFKNYLNIQKNKASSKRNKLVKILAYLIFFTGQKIIKTLFFLILSFNKIKNLLLAMYFLKKY